MTKMNKLIKIMLYIELPQDLCQIHFIFLSKLPDSYKDLFLKVHDADVYLKKKLNRNTQHEL